MSSELENSGIRVVVGDCSVTERRRWGPPYMYQTGKTEHVHAKHYKHNEDGRTAPGVRGNGFVPLSHSGNVVTRNGIHTHTRKPTKRTDFDAGCVQIWIRSAEPPGEHRYENGNNNENRQAMIIAINHHRNIALVRSVINLLGNGGGEGREFIDFTCAQPLPWIFL